MIHVTRAHKRTPLHLVWQLHIPREILSAKRDGGDARAGAAYFCRVQDATRCLNPRNHAQAAAEIEGRLQRAQLRVDAADVVAGLHLFGGLRRAGGACDACGTC